MKKTDYADYMCRTWPVLTTPDDVLEMGGVIRNTWERYFDDREAMQRNHSQDVWTVRPYPGKNKPLVLVSGLSYGILRSTPEQELATWLFIRWLQAPQPQAALVRAGGGYPMGPSTLAYLEDYRAENPQWGEALTFIPIAQIPPNTPAWRQAQWVVQDAFAQALQGTTPRTALPDILAELDTTLADVARGW